MPLHWKAAACAAWGAVDIDQTRSAWTDFVAERIVAPLWANCDRGLFRETLDPFRLAGDADPAARQQGLVSLTCATADRIAGLRIVPWGYLSESGIGRREAMPRRAMVLYDGPEATAINHTGVRPCTAMPPYRRTTSATGMQIGHCRVASWLRAVQFSIGEVLPRSLCDGSCASAAPGHDSHLRRLGRVAYDAALGMAGEDP